MEVLSEIALVLGADIPNQPDKIWELVWKTESLRFRLAMAQADAVRELSSRKLQVLLPKDKDTTELDRTTTQEAGAAEAQSVVNKIQLALQLTDSRIALLRDWAVYVDNKPKEE